MARIRTIKPEFWDSPGIENLDPRWRLLYIAMWNWADDTGSGKAEARELMGFAFPRDEDMEVADFRRGLGEIRRVFGVKFYKVDGRAFYNIPSWDRHQKIDKRSGSRWPLPESGETYDPATNSAPTQGTSTNSEEPAETPPNTRREVGAGTGEQGNRGTGEQKDSCPATQDEFIDWYLEYPRKEAKAAAEKAYAKARKKASAEALIAGATRYSEDPNREAQYTKLPATWLNSGCWDDGPLPARGQQPKPSGSQVRLQAGYDLLQETRAEMAGQLELGA